MNDYIRDILKDDPNLLKAYELSEAKYLVKLNGKYETVDVELPFSEEELTRFYKALAKHGLCIDEWACNQLIDFIIQKEMEEEDAKTSKYSENLED